MVEEQRPRPWDRRDWLGLAAVLILAAAVRFLARPLMDRPEFYFAKYPVLADQMLHGEGQSQIAFSASPLYLYFWYLLHVAFPGRLAAGVTVQFLLGAVSCALVAAAGRLFFSRAVGLVAGLIAALYAPLIVTDASFVSEGLVVLLNTGGLVFLGLALRDRESGPAAAAGLLFGLSGAARPNVLLLVPFAAAALWLMPRPERGRRLGPVAAFLAFAVAGPLAITARNWVVSGEPVFVMSDSGLVFFIGNNELDTGLSYVWPRHEDIATPHPGEVDPTHRIAKEIAETEVGRRLSWNETAGFWMELSLDWIRAHPGEYLRLLGRKLRYFWTAYEPHDVETTYEQERALRPWHLLGFGLVGPLCLLGLVVTAADWRRLLPFYGVLVTYTLTGLLFTVVARYRIPMVPAVIVLAATALVWLAEAVRERRRRPLLVALAATATAAVMLNHRDFVVRNMEATYEAEGGLANRAQAALQAHDVPVARQLYQQLEREAPTFMMVVRAQNALALLSWATGDLEAARRYRRAADGISLNQPLDEGPLVRTAARLADDPDDIAAWMERGAALLPAEYPEQALRCFLQVTRRIPEYAPAHYARAVALQRMGNLAEAERWARAARSLSPNLPGVNRLLVTLIAQSAGDEAALTEYTRLTSLYPELAGYHDGRAEALLLAARTDEARGELAEAARLDPLYDEVRERLAELEQKQP